MNNMTSVPGVDGKVPRGEKLVKGSGWRLIRKNEGAFKGTLLEIVRVNGVRLAVFRIIDKRSKG